MLGKANIIVELINRKKIMAHVKYVKITRTEDKAYLKWGPFYDSIFSLPRYDSVISCVHFQLLKSEILF